MPDSIPELEDIKKILRREPQGLSILEIAQKLDIGRNVVTKYLSMLHAAGQVKERRVATAKVYTLAHRVPVSALLELTSDLIVVLDRNLHVVLANDAFREVFCTGKDEIVGQSITALIPDHTIPPEINERTRAALQGEEGKCDGPWEVKGGTVQFRVKFIPVAFEDGTPGVTVILEDITCEDRATQALKKALNEREALMHTVHCRIRNALQMVSSIMHLQTSKLTDPAAKRAIRATEQQILSLALAHEDLSIAQNSDRVRMEDYLTRLTGTLIDRYSVPREKIAWTVRARKIDMPFELAQFVGFILTELIINVIQHAFPGEMTGEMKVTIEKSETDIYSACIRDTGVGIPEELKIAAELTPGLPTVRLLVEQYLNGQIAVRRGDGTEVVITFEEVSPFSPCLFEAVPT